MERYELRGLPETEQRELYDLWREQRLEAYLEDPLLDFEAWLRSCLAVPAHHVEANERLRSMDGALVGRLRMRWRQAEDNRHLAEAEIFVRPSHRRRGFARRLLAQAAEIADADGRSVLAMWTVGSVSSGRAFCEAIGARPVLEQHENRVRLAGVDRTLLRSWVEAGEREARDYELVLIEDGAPDELLVEVARAVNVMNTAPRGESVMEDEVVTPAEVREWATSNELAGRRTWGYFARHRPSGQFVGFTNIFWFPSTVALLHQGGTAVDPAHRGHGLGKWLKAAMLEKVFAELPAAEAVVTENAFVNDPMLSINWRLGFQPSGSETWWEIETAKCRELA